MVCTFHKMNVPVSVQVLRVVQREYIVGSRAGNAVAGDRQGQRVHDQHGGAWSELEPFLGRTAWQLRPSPFGWQLEVDLDVPGVAPVEN